MVLVVVRATLTAASSLRHPQAAWPGPVGGWHRRTPCPEGVYRMRKHFSSEIEHQQQVVAGGRPQFDKGQGGANFKRLVAKSSKRKACVGSAEEPETVVWAPKAEDFR